jgi:general secretion pathway protein M
MAAIGRAGRLTLPTGRAGRLLALGLLLLVLVLLWEVIGSPLCDWYRSRSEALSGREALAERMEILAARLPALRRDSEAGGIRPGAGALIDGSSDAIAGAALQGQVQQMASALGASLSSSETLPGSPAGGSGGPGGDYRRVGVRISVTAPFAVMVRLIAGIEQATPAMLVDDLQLHGSRLQLEGNTPLEATLTVLAFRHGEPDPAGRPDPAETGGTSP